MPSVNISDQNRGADRHINDALLFRWYTQFSSKRPDTVVTVLHILFLSSVIFILKLNKVEQESWILYAFCIINPTFLLNYDAILISNWHHQDAILLRY